MKQHVRANFQQIHPSCELQNLPGLKSFHFLFFKQSVNVSFIYCDSCSAFSKSVSLQLSWCLGVCRFQPIRGLNQGLRLTSLT